MTIFIIIIIIIITILLQCTVLQIQMNNIPATVERKMTANSCFILNLSLKLS